MAYVNIVTSDRGWILERLATEIAARLPYARFTGVVDPQADIQYYVTFATWKRRVSPVEVGYFAHQEQDPATARLFVDIAAQMDHCVCHARLYEQLLRDHGITSVTTIPPGVDLEVLKPVVKVGVVGRTYHTGRKGEALVQQVMDLPGLEWHFTGEGWPGPARRVPDDGMAAFYNEMDYILVPALYEGGPMCVAEALACGTPVIAPLVGWVPDFPHIGYRTGDAADLRRVLQAVVAERTALRAAAEPYTWDRWAAAHDALFQALAEGKGLGALTGPAAARPAPRQLKVALALHGSERNSLGGPSVRVPQTAARLRDLGHEAQAVFFPDPAILGAELVHGYNAWSPDTALAMARLVRLAGKRFVFSPIYLDLGEQAFWNRRLLEGLADASSAEEVAQRYPMLRQGFEQDRRGRRLPAEARLGYHAMLREMVELADHVICLSEHERAALAAIGAAPRACSIISNPVDADCFAEADPALFRAETGLWDFVLCVARVEPRKNQLLLLEALRETDLPVVLIGGETNPAYSRLIEHYAGDRLHRLGRIDPSSPLIASAMVAARVVALPSWSEGAPLAALEAAACGAKMVLSDRASERAYFGALARYCDPADIGSIRDAVLAAWDAPWAAADREALRHHVGTNYNWEKHVEATLGVYTAVLGTPAAPLPAAAAQKAPPGGALIMDLTTLADHKGRITGIARTELALARELIRHAGCEVRFIAFSDRDRRFVEIDPIAVMQGQVGSFRELAARDGLPLDLPTGVPLLVVGSAWLQSANYPLAITTLAAAHRLRLSVFVHDLIPLLFPHWFAVDYAPRFRANLRLMLANSRQVLCNSQNTARDLTQAALQLSVPVTPPVVVRLGDELPEADRPGPPRAALKDLAARPGFVLAVGAVHSRKNYGFLAELWASLRQELGSRCPRLVIVGGVAWNGADTARALAEDQRLHGLVVLLEDVDDTALTWLYDRALLTVYPSLYEGWGLPVAESLARGRICIASSRSSMPEIAPGLTDLVDPLDFPAWLAQLRGYVTGEAVRTRREAAIREGYRPHPWSATAQAVLAALAESTVLPACAYGYLPGQILAVPPTPTPELDLRGWHAAESWGVWSAEPDAGATLTLARAATGPHGLLIKARTPLSGGATSACDVTLNGNLVGRLVFISEAIETFVLPLAAALLRGAERLELGFRPHRMRDLQDGRRVGIGLAELALLTAGQLETLPEMLPNAPRLWVHPGDILDLTQPCVAERLFSGLSWLRPGWGRTSLEGGPLRLVLPLYPSMTGPVALRLRYRAAANAERPQVMLIRLVTGETVTRLVSQDDEVREARIALDVERLGVVVPLVLDIVSPVANSVAAVDLGADERPLGIGLFDVAIETDLALAPARMPAPVACPVGLTFGALLAGPAILAAPYLLASTWQAPELAGRWTNGVAGSIALPRAWLVERGRFWVEVAAPDPTPDETPPEVEILHEENCFGRAVLAPGAVCWVEVDATGLAAAGCGPCLVFWIRVSRTALHRAAGNAARIGVFVSRLAFEQPQHHVTAVAPPHAVGEPAAKPSVALAQAARLGLCKRAVRQLTGRSRQIAQWVSSGDRAMSRRAWAEATEAYEKALGMAPELSSTWVQYGHALKELGRPAEALYAYEMAMALEPQDAETLLHLAHLRSASGDISGALAAFDRVARSAARAELAGEARRVADGLRRDLGTGALIQLGDAANREQRWAEAAEAYAEALTQDRGLAHIWVQYGHCLKEQGHAEEAACAYHEALRHAPELEDAAKHLHALRERLGYLTEG